MLIYLIRHGQTTGDIEDRYGGDYEDHLTELGQKQADELAKKLQSKEIELIVASPRVRAQETALIVSKTLLCPVETDEDIRERNHYGVMTGMVKSEAREKYPQQVELLNDTKNTVEGGEPYEPFKERVMRFWKSLENYEDKKIAVITHGGVVRLIFREILQKGEIKIDDCAFAEISLENGSSTVLTTDGIVIQ